LKIETADEKLRIYVSELATKCNKTEQENAKNYTELEIKWTKKTWKTLEEVITRR